MSIELPVCLQGAVGGSGVPYYDRLIWSGGVVAREMLNVRVDRWLDVLISKAAFLSGAASKSEWAREALEAGARREIAAHEPSRPVQSQRLGGGFVRNRRQCQHPPTARVDHLRAESCGLCGEVTRVKS